MWEQDKVIAILCSDLHLCPKPPRARRGEPNWFDAMKNPLRQLFVLSGRYRCPIICAGDVFDHWKAEPELINFAINYLPEMYAVPGQHDLPLHSMDLIKRSAFWTMVLVGKINPLMPGKPVVAENNMVIHGFPWGSKIKPFTGKSGKLQIGVCHEYFWDSNHCFPGAPKEKESKRYRDEVQGYHAVAFGDNHKGFLTEVGGTPVLNCGGFMRRSSDEVDYEPQVGLLCKSGKIMIHKLRTEDEKFTTLEEEDNGVRKMLKAHDMTDFISGLSELNQKSFDFVLALEMAMEEKMVTNGVRKLILEALGRDK